MTPRETPDRDDGRILQRLTVLIRKSPVASAGSTSETPLSPVDDPIWGDEPELRGQRILSVEDSPIHQRILTRYVEQMLACRVLPADGVEGAVRILLRERPDLVVTDLMMPDLDGLDLIQIMRGDRDWRTIPIVVHSAANDLARIRTLSEYGVRGYILKPFDPDVALPRLRRALGAGGPRRTTREMPAPDGHIPIVVGTTDPRLGDVLARELPPMFKVRTVPTGPAVFVATMEIHPWLVFLAPDLADWDVTKTQHTITALRTVERVRAIPLPSLDRGERAIVDIVRREIGAGPFTIDGDGPAVCVVLQRTFTSTCVHALRNVLEERMTPGTSKLTFEIPASGLEGQALGAIQDLARAFRD